MAGNYSDGTLVHKSVAKGTKEGAKPIYCGVWEKEFDGKDGKHIKFKQFQVFLSKTYQRDGVEKSFRDSMFTLSRLGDVVDLLFDIDQQFNGGKGFARFVNVPSVNPKQVDLTNDEVPW